MIINAGIKRVIIRTKGKESYNIVDVEDWVKNDDLLEGKITY